MSNVEKWLTRKTGLWVGAIGIAIFLLNFLTLRYWEIDIDILGALFFVIGLIITIACGKSMKHSKELLSRKNGVLLCIFAAIVMIVLGYLPLTNGDVGGILGLAVLSLGILLIAARWNH